MDRLMHANLQVIELLGAVFEEVERQGENATARRSGRPSLLRHWIGRPRQEAADIGVPHPTAKN